MNRKEVLRMIYESPELEIVAFESEDVICTSNLGEWD